MMQKYAIFDENGLPKAFYSSEIHGDNIPKGAAPITEEQWYEFISNPDGRKWNFETNAVEVYESPKPSLEELRQIKLQQLKFYVESLLSQSDYVLLKIQEARELGQDVASLLEKYTPVLDKRQAIRDWNKQTKQAIMNAKTIKELEEIKIEIDKTQKQ